MRRKEKVSGKPSFYRGFPVYSMVTDFVKLDGEKRCSI